MEGRPVDRRRPCAARTAPDLQALACGELGIDKVVELARFATAKSEESLVRWARGVSCGCIRRRGDVAERPSIEEAREEDQTRSVHWWYAEGGRRFGLEADLPAEQGAVVAAALDRLAETLPTMPGEEGPMGEPARRADALVALASSRIAGDADPDRATVIIHAPVEALAHGDRGCQVEGGGVAHPETVRRLVCQGRLQVVAEDGAGDPVHVGRMMRVPRPGCSANSGGGMASVGSPRAGPDGSPRPTTSPGWSTVDGPS